jgi:acetyl-CoA C-acetyltransferase
MVEQGAALLMCSAERAEALGVPRDRWVFLHSGADASDHWFLSERWELFESPAIRLAGTAALELAATDADALAHVDLYSCFPSAVQIAARELGLDIERQLTVTGGMSFAGGPWNNYAMHGLATMADVLREDPGTMGLTTANGGYTTKHAFGVWSTEPPTAGAFRHAVLQDAVDALPKREVDGSHVGDVTIEAYTVAHDRDGSREKALLALRTPHGARTWGSSTDAALLDALEAEDLVGVVATIDAEGTTALAGEG